MPYCIAKYCTAAYENNPSNAHFHRLPQRCALRRQWLAKCGRPPGSCLQSAFHERRLRQFVSVWEWVCQ